MELTQEQFARISSYLPRQRGNVSISNLQFVNALLYITENGCKWRALPESFGNWHTIYMRMNRWSSNGVLRLLFEALQTEGIIQIKMEALCLDSTTVKVHPDGTGALKKEENKASGDLAEALPPKFIWSPHLTVRL
jgi:transposase